MDVDVSIRMPTGISSLDPVLDGGVPPGSMILLLGDVGAGTDEFVFSSVTSLALKKERKKGEKEGNLPEEICYITFTKLSDAVKDEIHLSFKSDLLAGIETQIRFVDLSEMYFEASIVPSDWYSTGDVLERFRKRGKDREETIAGLSEILSGVKEHSLIVMDSLTDLAVQHRDPASWSAFSAFLKGLQRAAKRWGTTTYLILTNGILDNARTIEIADICDAVIRFRWEESTGQRRQRIMFIEKFRGVMPHLEERDLVKFAVKISSESAFEVANIRVII